MKNTLQLSPSIFMEKINKYPSIQNKWIENKLIFLKVKMNSIKREVSRQQDVTKTLKNKQKIYCMKINYISVRKFILSNNLKLL